MKLYSGALIDGGAEGRRREGTPHPVRAVSIVAETKAAARALYPLLSEEDVESLALRMLYGRMTPGRA